MLNISCNYKLLLLRLLVQNSSDKYLKFLPGVFACNILDKGNSLCKLAQLTSSTTFPPCGAQECDSPPPGTGFASHCLATQSTLFPRRPIVCCSASHPPHELFRTFRMVRHLSNKSCRLSLPLARSLTRHHLSKFRSQHCLSLCLRLCKTSWQLLIDGVNFIAEARAVRKTGIDAIAIHRV